MPSSSSSSSSTSSSSTTTTTNRVMNNGHRKRNGSSLSNIKKIRRSELVKNSKDERPSRSSLSNSNSLNNITEEYSLTTENNRSSTLRPFGDSYDNNNSDIRRDLNSNKREIGSTENTSNSINKKATALSLIVKSTILNRQDGLQTNLVPSYDSDEELDKTKQNSNKILPMVVTPIITSSNLAKQTLRSDNNSVIIQQANGKSNLSAKIFKVVVPQAIKMLTNGDGLSSALRIPTKIQLTKTSSPIFAINQEQLNDQHQILSATTIDIREKQQSVVDYPLTPPPPPPSIIDIGNTNPHLLKQDSIKESNMVNNKENYSSLLSYDPNNNTSSVELNRQTSTPLSFHSIPPSSSSSAIDDQSLTSPHSQSIVSKTHIFTDIVNELIKGAKGLDKLSCSLVTFTNSIHDFIRLTVEKQNEKIESFQKELEKKCSSQLNRANIFCLKKIQYFTNKHSLISTNEYIEEITLLVKYFYLYVLILNCRKQEHEIELILNDLLNGKLTFINESFDSPIITTTIEDIMSSKLANDYLLSQPLIINQTEHSLPFICNTELENELLFKNETSSTMNPFSDLNDLEDYLNRCEHMSTTIPHHPVQQQPPPPPPVTYHPRYSHPSASAQYYYPSPQPQNMTPYYYHPNTSAYSNSQQQQPYPYNHPSCYYNPLNSYGTTYNTNEQYNFYYNQQTSYSHSHPNSTNDIPSSNNHQSYRRMNSNIQRQYSNPPQENQITPTGFDTCNNISPQSKSTVVPSNMYAP
ncbi:unnamed protein product [Adineta steineri]|uniref:Uncharacterized protein n=1 Tax=Adineta steineri TaxID=433720 RepID=A0A814THM8_9BILA|nr:unnamed protein product [Adineta steineri]